jgi:EAL domain-containing protein (putative c-di-GMP-specific phosphodiesterase class I)
MLEQSCRQLAAWHAAGLLPADGFVSVNIAARQLSDGSLTGAVADLLAHYELDPAAQHLEITETALMADVDHAISVLHELRGLGVRLAVDDFGTGQSSLTYLRRLPIDSVKVDQSFVFELGSDTSGATIVAAVVELAHALGLRVIAEGVERREHLEALVELGCDAAQGYLFARPMPAGAATEYLEAHPSRD